MAVLKAFVRLIDRLPLQRRWLWLLVLIAIVDAIIIYRIYEKRSEHRFDKIIRAAAERYGTDPSLVKAVIWRESAFNPNARGLAGEIGLMQIRGLSAGEWAEAERMYFFTHKDLFNPEANIMAGSWYLNKLLKRYQQTDNPVPYALADYNAGRTHALRWMKGAAKTNSSEFLSQMDYPGTRRYIDAITTRSARYRGDFKAEKTDK
jgi:soluble lytic murein transglycosylase